MAVPPAPDQRSGVTEKTSSASDPASDPASSSAGDSAGGPAGERRPTSHSLRLTLLVVLLALLVASGAAVGYLAATRPVPALGLDGDQEAIQSERESVMAQAEPEPW